MALGCRGLEFRGLGFTEEWVFESGFRKLEVLRLAAFVSLLWGAWCTEGPKQFAAFSQFP